MEAQNPCGIRNRLPSKRVEEFPRQNPKAAPRGGRAPGSH